MNPEASSVSSNTDAPKDVGSLVTVTTIVYALQAASIIVGITYLVAVIINYIKREEVAGTWLASHFRWQIRTFWYSLLWGVLGVLTFIIVIGWFILIADLIWVMYRVIKGWLYLADKKEMYTGGRAP